MEKAREHDTISDLQRALSLFKCSKDSDIEQFLHDKAIEYNARRVCYTYLICDEEAFDKGEISVQAYFTLSMKNIAFSAEVCNNQKRKIAGYTDRTSEPVVLIGQLGKYISEDFVANISLGEILNFADEIIQNATELIPCRASLVECSFQVHDKGLYSNEGYKYLQQDGTLYQYYKPISE